MKCKKKDCEYRRRIAGTSSEVCDFLIMTGKSRGCKPEECDKYIKKKKVITSSDLKQRRKSNVKYNSKRPSGQ